jgi:hypothetical protein
MVLAYRDKKVVVFVRFRAPLIGGVLEPLQAAPVIVKTVLLLVLVV